MEMDGKEDGANAKPRVLVFRQGTRWAFEALRRNAFSAGAIGIEDDANEVDAVRAAGRLFPEATVIRGVDRA